jgi:DMSO/TMAO reductase YedYZ molybdopterin-dependent catalytic subunit
MVCVRFHDVPPVSPGARLLVHTPCAERCPQFSTASAGLTTGTLAPTTTGTEFKIVNHAQKLPPGQQHVARDKWPQMGERMPRPDDSPWQVHVSGCVRHPASYSLDDLREPGTVERSIDLHCVTRWSKLGVPFLGVPLALLIEKAVPDESARYISFVARSERDHSTSLSISDALALEVIVALEAEGKTLPTERGGPVRLVVPGRYFYKSLKWLERIEVLGADRLGYWEATAGYHNLADPLREQRYIASNLSKAEAHAILTSRNLADREVLSLEAQGLDLAGLNARGARLRNVDFRGCCLRGACFDTANLTNGHLQNADLRDASLRGADLEGVAFAGADMRGACLLGASLVGASFGSTPADSIVVDDRTLVPRSAAWQLSPKQSALVEIVLAHAGAAWQ